MEAFDEQASVRKNNARVARADRLLRPHMPIQFDHANTGTDVLWRDNNSGCKGGRPR